MSVRQTEKPGDAERMAREAALSGNFDIVIAAGGDGTINEVASGLIGHSTPLGIVPAGTANVLALELGIGNSSRQLADALAKGTPREIWPGLANGRLFLAMASCGFDGRVLGGVSPDLKRSFGKGAYLLSGIRTWLSGGVPALEVRIDGGNCIECGWVIVANTKRYAGRFVIAPKADLFGQGFEVVVLPGGSRRDITRYVGAIIAGRIAGVPDVQIHSARELQITGPTGEIFELDGDSAGHLPVDITVASEPLLLVH